MNRSLSVTAKISILVVLALVFGAVMIGLSIRHGESRGLDQNMFGTKGDQNIDKTFTVQPDGDLVIDADEGEVSVLGTDSNQVSVQVIMTGDQERIDKYHVDFKQEGNTVRIEGRENRRHFRMFDDRSLRVRFEVKVPKKFNLDLQTSGGDLVIKTLNGHVVGTTSGGNLELTDIDGKVKLETSGGDIDVLNMNGDVVLTTSGGNIVAESVTGDFEVGTSGGNIRMKKIDAKLRAETSGGNIEVAMATNKGISLETSGGNVIVKLPRSIAGEIDASATGGDVDCDLQYSGKIKDGDMHGTINGGGNLIKASTSGGNISFVGLD